MTLGTEVTEKPAAVIFRVEGAAFSDKLVLIQGIAGRNIPQDNNSHRHHHVNFITLWRKTDRELSERRRPCVLN
jgi:hypothetical protein